MSDIEGGVLLSCADILALGLSYQGTSWTKRSPAVPNLKSAKLTGLMHVLSTRRSQPTELTNQSTCSHNQTHTTKQLLTSKNPHEPGSRLLHWFERIPEQTIPYYVRPKCATQGDTLQTCSNPLASSFQITIVRNASCRHYQYGGSCHTKDKQLCYCQEEGSSQAWQGTAVHMLRPIQPQLSNSQGAILI